MKAPITALLALLCAVASPAAAQSQLTLDYEALARRIVRQLDLKPGERVLSLKHPGLFEALIPHLRYEVVKAGGVDLGVIDVLAEPVPAGWDLSLIRKANPASQTAYREMLRGVDAAVMLPGAAPNDPAYAAMQDGLKAGHGRTVHFHWVEGGSAYPLPGQPLPARPSIDALYQRAVLESDCAAIGVAQREFEAALRHREVRVTTPAGTDLRFRIGDRPVNKQNGDASAARTAKGLILIDREIELPCGALRVAPLEESVEGVIAFPPSQWNEHPVEGLKLRFEKGRVVGIQAALGQDAAEAEIAQAGEAGHNFRELALGFDPLLAVPEESPWIPYYGYGAGVVRLSLGDNTELGGRVGGGYVRWNFFADATVRVGDTVFVEKGKLLPHHP
ncbi:MAG: aminopeptidase [Vicinamibacteria bacterium]